MKTLKQALLLSFISVLCLSQVCGEDNKKFVAQISNSNAISSETAKEKYKPDSTSISEKLSVNQNAPSHVKSNSKNSEPKSIDKDYLTEIKDSLHKIFDLCLIIGGIALIFIILKILYPLSKYIDSLTIRYARKKPANAKPIEEIKS